MLLQLHIRNFAVVPELDQEFLPGFTAISGETGAGKSILVDALGLLLGARSDSSWVRNGAPRAELVAEFDLGNNGPARRWLKQAELVDGKSCLLRRVIRANGRSSAWINGTPTTVSQLAELGNHLVEVHGQNEHVRLTGRKRQLELLDTTGDYSKQLEAVQTAYGHWRTSNNTLCKLEAQTALPPAEAEFLRHQLKQLQAAALPPEEVHALEQEHRKLASAGDLLAALASATENLDQDDSGALALLSRCLGELEPYRALDAAIDEAVVMLNEALINAQEANQSLQRALRDVDLNPAKLDAVSSQLSELGSLARKHGVSLEELPQLRDRIDTRLQQADGFEEQREQLREQLKVSEQRYRQAARALSKARMGHAKKLATRVEAVMGQLGMQGGQFLIDLQTDHQREPGPGGDDVAELLVSANAGSPPAPLAKVASGGELSRISLAIKVVSSGSSQGRTQVFDEIDTGVGGETANAVGDLLKSTAVKAQALCVTHLAQVAVRADHQLQVLKHSSSDTTQVKARLLDQEHRVEEIARMLGGTVSHQSRAHAREMLEAATSTLQ